jgi:cytochrome b561
MAVCILSMLFIGVGMVSTVMPKYLTLVSIHKSLGVAILVLALIRLAVRLRYRAPSLPADLPEPMKLVAYLSHYALYALMIGMPLIGWAMLSAAAYPVVLFGGMRLPAILPQNDSLHALFWVRISTLLSHSLRWSFSMSRRRSSMRSSDVTAYSKQWRPCRSTTKSRPQSEGHSGRPNGNFRPSRTLQAITTKACVAESGSSAFWRAMHQSRR